MLLIKTNTNGTVIWKKLISIPVKGYIYAKSCKVDEVGNLYVVGYFNGATTIGTKTIHSLDGDNSFIAKFNSNGDGLWASSFNSTGTGENEKFVLDSQKNIYIISRSSKLLKFDTNGNKLWEQSYSDKTLQGIAINGATLYIAGVIMSGTTNFGNISLTSLGGTYTGVVLKADLDGNFTNSFMVKGYNTLYGSTISDIQIDKNGKLLITGYYRKNLELGTLIIANTSNSYYTFLAKCNDNFEFEWSRSSAKTNPTSLNTSDFLFSYRIYQDNSDDIYQFGSLKATVTFDSIAINASASSYMYKFNANGKALRTYNMMITDGNNSAVTPVGKILIGNSINDINLSYGDFIINQYTNNFDWEWQSMSSNSFSGTVNIMRVKHDAAGNTYIYGTTLGKTNFFGTPISYNSTTTFIAKLDANGQKVWSHFIADDNTPSDYGTIFTLDKDNNVVFTGSFAFQLKVGQDITLNSTGIEGYVAKISSAGVVLWASKFDDQSLDYYTTNIATDHSGNVLITGVNSPANYILKFDSNGNKLWLKTFSMESYYLSLISTDENNNIYLSSEVHLDNTSATSAQIGTITLNQTATDGSIVLVKFDPNGNAIWAKPYGGVSGSTYTDGWPCSIKTDKSGNTYIWGWCVNNAKFGNVVLTNPFATNKNYSYFLTKVNTDGDVVWANAVYESLYAFNYGDVLDIDNVGNVYVGGHFKSNINIDNNVFMPQNTNDFFVAKFNGSGVYQWIKTIPATSDIIRGMSVYKENVVTVAGYPGTADALGQTTINKVGGVNVVVATLGSLQTGTSEIARNTIQLYPNPATNYIHLSNLTGECKILIKDIAGKTVLSTITDQSQLNISSLSKGVYFIQIIDVNGEIIAKFIKE